MNAMNLGVRAERAHADVLERYFRRRTARSTAGRDVLWGLAKMLIGEPRFLRQLGSSAWVYLKSQLPDRRFRHAIFGRSPAGESLAAP